MKESIRLKNKFVLTLVALLCVLVVITASTAAWYIFTASARTTRLHLAAGTGMTLQISDREDGSYSSTVALERFRGKLEPVSTDRIQNGFQRVTEFIRNSGEGAPLLADVFEKSLGDGVDYYKTSLYFRATGGDVGVYLADISFTDSDPQRPISSAIRIGFVVPSTGSEYIFAISDMENPWREYNTRDGYEGCVLSSVRTDGTTVKFTPLDKNNFCVYDRETGETSLKSDSTMLFAIESEEAEFSAPVRVDIYIWLEGCDADCTGSLATTTLADLALSFAGYR